MSCNSTALKANLTAIQNNDYLIGDGQEYLSLSWDMLEHLGSPDPELRDDLIYDIFAKWIKMDRLRAGELRSLLDACLSSSHLFYRIGESGTDSVYARSFSALVVALIINAHRRGPFLSDNELYNVKARIENYLVSERDVRGFVEGKGWAHAAAHAADALDELARCDSFSSPDDMRDILAAVKARVETDYYAFIHEEDERLVTAVVGVMGRKILDDDSIVQWLESFCETRRITRYPEDLYLRANIKSFFRSFYFRLSKLDGSSPIITSLQEMMNKQSRF